MKFSQLEIYQLIYIFSLFCFLNIWRRCCASAYAMLNTEIISTIKYIPIKNYRVLSPNYRGKWWAYVHLIRGAANHPIILRYETCKCVSCACIISEASTKNKYEEKMHIEVSETIFLRLFQQEKWPLRSAYKHSFSL